MNPRVVAIFVVAVLLTAACGTEPPSGAPPLVTTTSAPAPGDVATPNSSSSSSSSSTSAAPLPPVEIAQIDCPVDLSRSDGVGVACGVITVPVDRTDASVGTTRVTLATVAGYDSGFDTPAAVLQGGPGGASSDLATWFPQQPFTQVFVDQRGTGFVGSDFDCPEILDAMGRILSSSSAEAGIVAQNAYADCGRRLDDDIVLQHTESEEHATDVADAMAALGYDRWVAYGVSYGSTIGLELMRDEPAGLVGVVLDGVYPPELDADAGLAFSAARALDELDAVCAADSTCRRYLSDGSVKATLERVMEELDSDPMIVELGGNRIGYTSDIDLVLDGRRLAEFTFLLLYQEAWMRYLPAILGSLDDRDPSSAQWMASIGARTLISSQEANDEGTYLAVQCHDRLPFTTGPGDDLEPFPAAVAAASLEGICGDLDHESAPPAAGEPVESSLPALLLSGRFDPITPPEYAEDVAARLENATVVEQDGRGHGIWFGSDCIAQIVFLFVEDPAREVDTACADDGDPVEWARP